MGIFFSSGSNKHDPAKDAAIMAKSREIDEKVRNQQLKEANFAKLLLLGAGESGKSTLFKQMMQIYGSGFDGKEREKYLGPVHANCIIWMRSLIQNCSLLNERFGLDTVIPSDLSGYAEDIMALDPSQGADTRVTPELVVKMKALWASPQIQLCWENRAKFQIGDSAKYFFDNRLDDIAEKGYVPSDDDVLRVRVKTSGVVESEFKVMESKFRIIDVGGQRSERKKWMHCFENVTGVIFVAAMNEYDQTCEEDEKTNRLTESLGLFYEHCNSPYLDTTAMLLFLNKEDLFKEKITKIPLTVYDPTYSGGSDLKAAEQFITNQFLQQNQNPNRTVYVHLTTATNKDNVNMVFRTVKDIVLKDNLMSGGLL